jgi:hypothetical protein
MLLAPLASWPPGRRIGCPPLRAGPAGTHVDMTEECMPFAPTESNVSQR